MAEQHQGTTNPISTFNEKALHSALKSWYARPGDRHEVPIDGFIIDVVRDDLLIEIQTRNFSAIRRKLLCLTAHHHVRLVYPIAQEKWIVKIGGKASATQTRRKSPKRGCAVQIFEELVSFPHLIENPNFSVHVLFIQEEEAQRYDGRRGWRRRGWVVHERRLLQVVGQRLFLSAADMATLIPPALTDPFTTRDLATAMGKPRRLAQKMAYCLREMGAITALGKRGNAIVYGQTAA
jgi:hypothetical protein